MAGLFNSNPIPAIHAMHAGDLARAWVWALFNYDEDEPLIVAGEEVSVRRLAELVCTATGFAGGLAFEDGAVDGPLRRTADTSRLAALRPEFQWQALLDSIRTTAAWYMNAQNSSKTKATVTAHVQVAPPFK